MIWYNVFMNDELKVYLEGMEKRIVTHVDAGHTDLGESITSLATHMDERFDEIQPILNKVEGHETRLRYLEEKLPKLATN